MKCKNCGREVFGFWRLVIPRDSYPVCSKHCLRRLLVTGVIAYLVPREQGTVKVGVQTPIMGAKEMMP